VVSGGARSGAQVDDARALLGTLNTWACRPTACAQPAYSMKADAWVNSSALLGRMNFALGLAAEKYRSFGGLGTAGIGRGDAQQALAALENSLLAGDVSKQTMRRSGKQLDDPQISQRKTR